MTHVPAEAARSTKNAAVQICKTMNTKIYHTDAAASDREVIAKGAKVLQEGGLVAFPTETVYGLGANGLDGEACKRIYEAKGRPSDNPLILHISQMSELHPLVREIPPVAEKLMDAFWPGPLTMIFLKSDRIPREVTGGLDTVAVRFPSHPVAMALIRAAGIPVAAPSANTSGRPSPTRASHVAHDLNGKIDMILDGGNAEWGLESTIVDVSVIPPMILRPGAVTKEMLEDVVGQVQVDPSILEQPKEGLRPKAPGMKYTHYAPKAEVYLVEGSGRDVTEKINKLAEKERLAGKRVGVLATEESKDGYRADVVLSAGRRTHLEEIGASLFWILRQFDELDADMVYAETFPLSGEGLAIMNRLQKSAGYRIIKAGQTGGKECIE